MLIVPVLTKSDTKKIPYICFLIIAVNCLIFFLLQSRDSVLYENAYSYYEESGLFTIELNAYKNYLAKKGHPVVENEIPDDTLSRMMFADDQFREELEDSRIITSNDPVFAEWQQKRTTFDSLLHQISVYKYGYSPKDNNYAGLLTCIFFHGSLYNYRHMRKRSLWFGLSRYARPAGWSFWCNCRTYGCLWRHFWSPQNPSFLFIGFLLQLCNGSSSGSLSRMVAQ